MEGFLYAKDRGVIISGTFMDKVPKGASVNPIGRWYKPWYYK